MNQRHPSFPRRLVAALGTACLLSAFGIGGSAVAAPADAAAPLPLPQYGTNAVSFWDEIANTTVNAPASPTGTDSERLPLHHADMATVHIAMYDAAVAITGTHKPFRVVPTSPTAGASVEAAVTAAAYGVLKGLFPHRTALYEAQYYQAIGTLPDGPAKTLGLAVGTEVATRVLADRANDGRMVALPPYVPGTGPGEFRGLNPVNRFVPNMRTFGITSASQFRADGPPALDSDTYAADLNETKAYGAANSAVRTFEQTEAARFHTEPPPRFWARNLRQFGRSQPTLADNARLMAMLYVGYGDAVSGCFDSKYHYQFWRPFSAITLADTDGNPATEADPAWTPVVPTPNHPEYPAAHACVLGVVGETLRQFFGTKRIAFSFDSTVAGISPNGRVHAYDSTDDLGRDAEARIWGGMHFRTSVVHGRVLGEKTARWVAKHHFQPRE